MGHVRKALNWYARLSPGRGKVIPPYEHVVQIGDPTLRKKSEPVPKDRIKTEEIQKIISKLHYVLNKYGSVGMSAPQIGINLRIFILQFTSKQLAGLSSEIVKSRDISLIPFTVFVNPVMKVSNYQKVILNEGCESVRGFAAEVPRFKEVEISGFNENGEATKSQFSGWSARIVQHEMDHLDGKLYTDIMERKSLHCTCWEDVNLSQGKVVIPFTPS